MTKIRALVVALVILAASNVVNTILAVGQATHADQLATTIQQQRVSITLANCVDQNAHHDGTVAALNRLLVAAEGKATPAARARIAASEAPTLLLINALAPKRDCAAVVEKTTGMRGR
jgi:hypothetical protein